MNGFAGALTIRDRRDAERTGKTPNPSTRRYALSVGIEVLPDDQLRLPSLSKDKILDYLDSHYVSVQARVQKDSKGVLYLHQRPIVATANFGRVRQTDDFHPAVVNAVKDMHAVGLYVPPKVSPTSENLRTAVLIHKYTGLNAQALKVGTNREEPHYEFVFIRGRSSTIGTKLDLHVFVTTEERTKLHYVKPSQPAPGRFSDCLLRAQVYFTKYTDNGLVPSESVVRSQTVIAKGAYTLGALDSFVKETLKLTDALTNLSETLDAIIDNKVKPDIKAVVSQK
jgi:hypothetical protein